MMLKKWFSAWTFVTSFIRSRFFLRFTSRKKLALWQSKQMEAFLANTLPKAPFYKKYKGRDLSELPFMDKSLMMSEFSRFNTCGIDMQAAEQVAKHAEQSRDFDPTINDLTVGMSSGTSGQRGLFLVSDSERAQWAGTLLAQTMPTTFVWQLLQWWKPKLSIAFFLRANSNLYQTLNGKRIDFNFYDLLQGVDAQVERLQQQQPQVLVAPATVLARLARLAVDGNLSIRTQHIVSVAEVLEVKDALLIELAFGCKPQQIYQATEGFLGYSCEHGKMHLNEAHLHIEKEWLDKVSGRFHPIVTDFSRKTQLIVRYRLNDILRVSDRRCRCGRADTLIEAIEGRSDQILWLPAVQDGTPTQIFPDVIRRALMLVSPSLLEYSIKQVGRQWTVSILGEGCLHDSKKSIKQAIDQLCKSAHVHIPRIIFSDWVAPKLGAKSCRIWCVES